MSDAFTDISRQEKEDLDYFSAVLTISKYITDRAIRFPSGKTRDSYLNLVFNGVDKEIKRQVEDFIRNYESDKDA